MLINVQPVFSKDCVMTPLFLIKVLDNRPKTQKLASSCHPSPGFFSKKRMPIRLLSLIALIIKGGGQRLAKLGTLVKRLNKECQ